MKPTDNYPICFPVFGMKMEGKAFLAVIEQGAAQSVIHALPDGKNTSYANAYAHFVLRASDSFVIGEDTGRPQSTNLYQKEPIQIDGVRIGYRFLAGEQADYVGMAFLYREYLQQVYGLTGQTAEALPLYLDIYGAAEKKRSILGIPIKQQEQLSDFADMEAIAKELAASGVSGIQMNLKSWSRDQLAGKVDGSLRPSGTLGSAEEMTRLADLLAEQGGGLYPEVGIQLFTKSGNGISRYFDVTKSLSNAPAFIFTYYDSTRVRNKEIPRQSMVTATKLPALTTMIRKNAEKAGWDGLSLPRFYVYSDFGDTLVSQSSYAARLSAALGEWADLRLLMDNPGDFLLPYTAAVLNLPVESSRYDLTDVSIPFVQLALSGLVPYAVEPINLDADSHRLFLKALETGSTLHYALITKDNKRVIDTRLNTLFSADYALWRDEMLQAYEAAEQVRRAAAGSPITGHEMLTDEVTATTYGNGVRVLINYGTAAYTADGVTVEAGGYRLLNPGDGDGQ